MPGVGCARVGEGVSERRAAARARVRLALSLPCLFWRWVGEGAGDRERTVACTHHVSMLDDGPLRGVDKLLLPLRETVEPSLSLHTPPIVHGQGSKLRAPIRQKGEKVLPRLQFHEIGRERASERVVGNEWQRVVGSGGRGRVVERICHCGSQLPNQPQPNPTNPNQPQPTPTTNPLDRLRPRSTRA